MTEDGLGWFWSLLHAIDAPGCNINIWLYKLLSLNQIKSSVAMYVPPCHEESPLGVGNWHILHNHKTSKRSKHFKCNFESVSTFVVVHIEQVLNCL